MLFYATAIYSSVSTARQWKQKAIHEQLCSPELEVRILDGKRVTYSMWQLFFGGVGWLGGLGGVSTCTY